MSNKQLNKIIQEIKQKTQSLKDKRKNVRYKLSILNNNVEPTCKYGVNYLEYLNTLSEFDRMYIEVINLQNEISDLTKEINRVGNVILYLRGDKWRVWEMSDLVLSFGDKVLVHGYEGEVIRISGDIVLVHFWGDSLHFSQDWCNIEDVKLMVD